MSTERPERPLTARYSDLLTLIFWGFLLVFLSFFFLYIGYQLDQKFGSTPSLMIGLFLLPSSSVSASFTRWHGANGPSRSCGRVNGDCQAFCRARPSPLLCWGKITASFTGTGRLKF